MIKNQELKQKAIDNYLKTGDILQLQKRLGHKKIQSTFAFIQRNNLFAKHLEQFHAEKVDFSREHRQDKPPVVFNIVVPGVGLEPTKACARGS